MSAYLYLTTDICMCFSEFQLCDYCACTTVYIKIYDFC